MHKDAPICGNAHSIDTGHSVHRSTRSRSRSVYLHCTRGCERCTPHASSAERLSLFGVDAGTARVPRVGRLYFIACESSARGLDCGSVRLSGVDRIINFWGDFESTLKTCARHANLHR